MSSRKLPSLCFILFAILSVTSIAAASHLDIEQFNQLLEKVNAAQPAQPAVDMTQKLKQSSDILSTASVVSDTTATSSRPGTVEVYRTPEHARVKGHKYFINYDPKCNNPLFMSNRQALYSALGGVIQDSYSSGITADYVVVAQPLPEAEIKRIPCLVDIEEDQKLATRSFQSLNPEDVAKGLSKPPEFNLWGLDRMDGTLNKRYYFDQTGKGVNIYIIDSGIQASHPDFDNRANIIYLAPNVTGQDRWDCTGHGTHVSGIAAGRNVGVAKESKINVLRVLGCSEDANNNDIINALEFLSKNISMPAVINLSLGPKLDPVTKQFPTSPSLVRMLNRFTTELKVPVVLAAGNDGVDKCTPLASDVQDIIVVGAMDPLDQKADFSNYGECITVWAPGVDIWSAAPPEKGGNAFVSKQGTSQAAPFVTGVVALLLQKDPTLSPAALKTAFVDLARSSVKVKNASNTNNLGVIRTPLDAKTRQESENALKSSFPIWFYIAIAGGGVFAAVIIVWVVTCCIRKRNRSLDDAVKKSKKSRLSMTSNRKVGAMMKQEMDFYDKQKNMEFGYGGFREKGYPYSPAQQPRRSPPMQPYGYDGQRRSPPFQPSQPQPPFPSGRERDVYRPNHYGAPASYDAPAPVYGRDRDYDYGRRYSGDYDSRYSVEYRREDDYMGRGRY
ncbi:peptidase S8/S53 domain-containing protein [Paraphysoderma sedebokerense]|nr:peptidase S8/S53 domain-containing protein [Paraphysoderma sedebokerense]